MARRGLVSSAAAFAAIGCLCLVATLTQRSGGGVELKSRRGRGSDDDQLLDASGQPFHWGPDDHAGGGRARRSSKTAKIHNGVRYASGMPWAKRDHWSAAETSDTSPGSLHHRLVREGAHDTASGVQSLCNRLTSGGDSTADDPGSTIHTHMHACVCMQACRCTYMCMCACAGASSALTLWRPAHPLLSHASTRTDYTAQAGTGWNPGQSAADYIMCDGVM